MNPLIQLKKATPPFLGVFVLVCLTLSLRVQAVVPPPDGGYPNFTTAEGQNALLHLTSGAANTGLGWSSLLNVTTGSFNTAVGAGTLVLNTADRNTATGTGALLSNTIGSVNTADGAFALFSNTEGGSNTATGASALYSNTTGALNTAIGQTALYANTIGSQNTATGVGALFSNNGVSNTATGYLALFSNTIGNNNTAVGAHALEANTTGDPNTGIGFAALRNNTTGNGNIALGAFSGSAITTAHDVICIGPNLAGANISNSCFIDKIWDADGGTQAVYVNQFGKLGAMVSSRRFKDEIKPMEQASEIIYGLKPVSFRYKPEIEPSRPRSFGLIAEQVEKVQPDLVLRDKEGKPYSVRYDQVNAMLLNEFLKTHKAVQELKREIAALAATVKEQAAQIQKVSAQIEMSERASQTVAER